MEKQTAFDFIQKLQRKSISWRKRCALVIAGVVFLSLVTFWLGNFEKNISLAGNREEVSFSEELKPFSVLKSDFMSFWQGLKDQMSF